MYDAIVDGVAARSTHRRRAPPRASTSSRRPSRWPAPSSSSPASIARERRLRRLVEPVAADYDVIFIDCPPSLGLLTVNALTAADAVLIPLQCEYYALEGLTQLLATIDLVRDHLNPPLDARRRRADDVRRAGRTCPPTSPPRRAATWALRSTTTVIPRSVRLSEAPSHGLPITRYAPESRGADRLRRLAARVPHAIRPRRPPSHAQPTRRPEMQRWCVMTVRPERAPGPRPRPRRADPAAHRGPARADRDRDRPDPAEPAPAPPALRRGRARDPDREHPRARRPPADPRHRDHRRLPARRRRAAAARGRRRPASSASRRSSASSTTRPSSRSRSSRTSSARTSTRSRPRTASGGSSTSSGSARSRSPTRVGRARSTVANTLRLLDLAPAVQAAVADRRITEGHARALGGLSVEHQDHVLGTVIDQDLSVRQTEELVRRLREPRPAPADAAAEAAPHGPRPGAGRGGPPPGARHEGEPGPLAPGRPDRDRVLQRRGTRAAVRPPDRRDRVTEEAITKAASGSERAPEARARRRHRLHRRQHPGPRGPGGGPPPPGHVHRLDR